MTYVQVGGLCVAISSRPQPNSLFLDGSFSPSVAAQISFALHPNGSEIVTASRSLLLRHWDIATGVCKRAIKAHDHIVRCMDYDGWVVYNVDIRGR